MLTSLLDQTRLISNRISYFSLTTGKYAYRSSSIWDSSASISFFIVSFCAWLFGKNIFRAWLCNAVQTSASRPYSGIPPTLSAAEVRYSRWDQSSSWSSMATIELVSNAWPQNSILSVLRRESRAYWKDAFTRNESVTGGICINESFEGFQVV